ncbi:hypothetical protein [Bifidobacterium pullorum]|uniref:hypothetical protein n=1 Tax=Bifidobacterium pullorum TaxID=78448 RepID=UPI001955FA97|nr:hypothetical protein [Bifidobacterium pullorum]
MNPPQQPYAPQQPAAPQQPFAPQQPASLNGSVPGKGAATASLVLGIVGVVCWFFGWSSIVSVICGVIGLILSSNAKKAGFDGGIRTAGFVLSIIALAGGALVFVACVACVGLLAGVGASMS